MTHHLFKIISDFGNNFIKPFTAVIYKARVFVPGKHSQPTIKLRLEAKPTVEHLKEVPGYNLTHKH